MGSGVIFDRTMQRCTVARGIRTPLPLPRMDASDDVDARVGWVATALLSVAVRHGARQTGPPRIGTKMGRNNHIDRKSLMLLRNFSRWAESPSSRESLSLGISPSSTRSQAFSAGVRAWRWRGRQRRIWCGDMAPNGGNIFAGLNSSTAVSMIRWLNEPGSGSSKAEHSSLIVPGKR
jgi:hypothetical protein